MESDAPHPRWHELSPAVAAERLNVDPARGLDAAEAARRLAQHGPNALREGKRRGLADMLLAQFADFMILVLIGAAVLAGLLGDVKDAAVIAAIVVLNAAIGAAQEARAARAIAELKKLAAAAATVVRDGAPRSVPTETLVPGDVVVLEAGAIVPADARLLEAARLQTDESALTGESVPVEKTTDAVAGADLALGDRRSLAFKGTLVTAGRGRGIVVATGMASELGRVAGLLDPGALARTPLQRRMAAFGRRLAVIVVAVCGVIFALGVARGEPPLVMFLTALSLAVAAIPEALPAALTVALALGAQRMARQNAVVRRLAAAETLGSVTTICSDKTGTLTRNEMVAERLEPAADEARLLTAMALNHDARRLPDGTLAGDPTETALVAAARAKGFAAEELARRLPRIGELPFDSARMRMTTLHRDGDTVLGLTKGAPEAMLAGCVDIDHAAWRRRAEAMAADGLRVIAFAERRWPAAPDPGPDPSEVERALSLLGLVGLMDPPRPEAAPAVAACRAAGITPVMITGDHSATARAIGRRLGFLEDDGAVLAGPELARLDEAQLADRVAAVRVYARVDPAQKIRIVEALQRGGAVVAMTGDGVNDAPALQRADIGVAMGRGGTDVAREAAALVLLDDNFATIVAAVREGRRIFDNIRKLIRFLMTGNLAEILTILAAPLLGLPLPLLPIHILWINLVTDGLPAVALAFEPAERNVMQRPPRPPQEAMFAGGLGGRILWGGLLLAGAALLAQGYALATGSAAQQTMVFTVLTLAQMSLVLAIRAEGHSALRHGLGRNRTLLLAVLAVVLAQLAIVYLPAGNAVFDTVPLSATELALCAALSVAVFLFVEADKWRYRRGRSASK